MDYTSGLCTKYRVALGEERRAALGKHQISPRGITAGLQREQASACRWCRAAVAAGQTDMSSKEWEELEKNVYFHKVPLVSLPRRRAVVQG